MQNCVVNLHGSKSFRYDRSQVHISCSACSGILSSEWSLASPVFDQAVDSLLSCSRVFSHVSPESRRLMKHECCVSLRPSVLIGFALKMSRLSCFNVKWYKTRNLPLYIGAACDRTCKSRAYLPPQCVAPLRCPDNCCKSHRRDFQEDINTTWFH